MTAGIHFQYMTENRDIFDKLIYSGKPFAAFIVPNLLDKTMKTPEGKAIHNRIHSDENYYPDWTINYFQENSDNQNITWIQEGNTHCCNDCFEKYEKNNRTSPDPYHEHVCLDGHAQSLEKQIKAMENGRDLINRITGIIPAGYEAPNNLFNKDTIRAAQKLGFKYFITRNGFDYFLPNVISLPAYREKDLIIIPETKFGKGKKSPIISTYYDHLANDEQKWKDFQNILDFSTSLSALEISVKPGRKVWTNDKLIIGAKKIRDLSKKQ